jgi:hypothetical protein
VAKVESAWVSVGIKKPELRIQSTGRTRLQISNTGNLKTPNVFYTNQDTLDFKIYYQPTGKGISCCTTSVSPYYYPVRCSGAFDSNATTFLDSQDSLKNAKALVFRNSDGVAQMCIDTAGHVRVRINKRTSEF